MNKDKERLKQEIMDKIRCRINGIWCSQLEKIEDVLDEAIW
jgi:hypothetical protein